MTRTNSIYHHTQVGTALIIIYSTLCLFAALLMLASGLGPLYLYVMLFAGVALACFATLTVVVDESWIVLEFYLGFPRKKFRLDRIVAHRIVRNRWYYGLGIRYTPHGWLFAISGLDAVEIELDNQKRFRIGTNDPQGLADAITGFRNDGTGEMSDEGGST